MQLFTFIIIKILFQHMSLVTLAIIISKNDIASHIKLDLNFKIFLK